VAKGLQFAQPASQHGRDAIQRQLGVDLEQALRLASGQMFLGVEAKAALELRQRGCRQSKAYGECVAAKARKKICAALDRVQ